MILIIINIQIWWNMYIASHKFFKSQHRKKNFTDSCSWDLCTSKVTHRSETTLSAPHLCQSAQQVLQGLEEAESISDWYWPISIHSYGNQHKRPDFEGQKPCLPLVPPCLASYFSCQSVGLHPAARRLSRLCSTSYRSQFEWFRFRAFKSFKSCSPHSAPYSHHASYKVDSLSISGSSNFVSVDTRSHPQTLDPRYGKITYKIISSRWMESNQVNLTKWPARLC